MRSMVEEADGVPPCGSGPRRPGESPMPRAATATLVAAAFVAAAAAVAALSLWRQLPPSLWLPALLHPAPGDVAALLFRDAALPRVAAAFLAGAGLALSGMVCQAVLDNPLAAPSTLGVSAGAQLALAVAAVALPSGLPLGREGTAALGALLAMGFVGLVAARQRFSPAAVVLAGLAVGLLAGALGAALELLDREDAAGVFLWGAGSLAGAGPATVLSLLPRLAVLALAAALMARPLALLGLGAGAARGLGVPVLPLRVAALAVAALLAAAVTASLGVIAFVELLAPALARAAGARRLGAQMLHAPVIGGAILVLVDAAARAIGDGLGAPFPAGAAAALFGAPALLVLALRLRGEPFRADAAGAAAPAAARARPAALPLAALAVALLAAVAAALAVGRTGAGWAVLGWPVPGGGADWSTVIDWRLPRTLSALGAGALLGGAGALLQRLTGNALVGPETLGVGAGATAGLAAALMLGGAASPPALFAAGLGGAGLALLLVAAASARGGFAPGRLLLVGVSLGAALQSLLTLVLATGDARAARLLAFVSGSTYAATPGGAAAALGLAALLCPAALLLGRPLDVLPLGGSAARALGLPLGPTRGLVALLAAAMTVGAVETVGPLSFVGLVGPQVAARLGCRRARAHLAGAALVGALAMVAADALGRTVAAPFELPAGLVAAAVGVPFFAALLLRRSPA